MVDDYGCLDCLRIALNYKMLKKIEEREKRDE